MFSQALLDHLKPEDHRQDHNGHVHLDDIASVVSLFWDDAGMEHIFSIHHICQAAQQYGSEMYAHDPWCVWLYLGLDLDAGWDLDSFVDCCLSSITFTVHLVSMSL